MKALLLAITITLTSCSSLKELDPKYVREQLKKKMKAETSRMSKSYSDELLKLLPQINLRVCDKKISRKHFIKKTFTIKRFTKEHYIYRAEKEPSVCILRLEEIFKDRFFIHYKYAVREEVEKLFYLYPERYSGLINYEDLTRTNHLHFFKKKLYQKPEKKKLGFLTKIFK